MSTIHPHIGLYTSGLGGHIAISGCWSSSQSFGPLSLNYVVIENLTVAVVNDHNTCTCFST